MREEKICVETEKPCGLGFWACAGLLAILLATSMSRDITRPFYGMHSWAEAHGPWHTRVHLKYGLGYTKGWLTKAVGYPPTENPTRYLDHPQLQDLVNIPFMAVFGYNEWALRIANTLASVITLLLFLKILRGLLDDKTALLAGLFFCFFPVIAYFGVNMWLYPFALWAIWNYLVLIKALNRGPEPGKLNKILLALSLFMMMQFSWEGFFFALGIGVHYLLTCLLKKQFPDISLLTILVVAPLGSLLIVFTIMAAGYNWEVSKIVELFNWRAGSGEMPTHIWSDWFARFWEYAVDDFTLPIMIIAIVYLTVGQLAVFTKDKTDKYRQGQFPQFLVFFLPPVFQLFILKGCLWQHQTWIRPFCFVLAAAAALGIMLLADALKKANKRLGGAIALFLITVVFVFSVIGSNYYYGIRWQSPVRTEMFKSLNQRIPPDKALLSFEDFIVNQHKSKGAFYRPEVAWYLDRDIVQATSFEEMQRYAQTGRYPCYLIPYADQLAPLINQLRAHYNYQYVQGHPGEQKRGKFYRVSMYDYMIFDLTGKTGAPTTVR